MTNKKLIACLKEWGAQERSASPSYVDAHWLEEKGRILHAEIQRDLALMAVENERPMRRAGWFSLPVLRPVFAGALVVAVALSGWVTTVNAALGSVPGDVLYSVKRASEKMQVTLATDKKTETRLRAEFTGRRAEEITKIASRQNGQKSEQVTKTVEALTKEITIVKSQLEAMGSEEPNSAAEVAQVVDHNASVAARALSFSSEGLSEEGRFAVAEARAAVADAAIAATGVIVETHLAGVSGVSAGAARSTVDDRIRSFEAQVSGAAITLEGIASTSTLSAPALAPARAATQAAQGVLAEARTSLAQDDLAGALLKVKEVRELASAAEKKVEEVKEAAKMTGEASKQGEISEIGKTPQPSSPSSDGAGQVSKTVAPKPADEPVAGVTSGSNVIIDFQIEE